MFPSNAPSIPGRGAPRSASLRVLWLPALLAVVLGGFALLPAPRENAILQGSLVGASAVLLGFVGAVLRRAARRGHTLAFRIVLRKQHWVQACAQASIFLYWGFYWREVYDYAYLIAAQLVFAYAFDALLTWWRRDDFVLGFGPFPIILSTNLFLWFRPDWFYLQFVMVALGFAAKESIRWTKNGHSAHIFNPSSFSLSVFSIGLIVTGSTDISWGAQIGTTLILPPHIYLWIFSVSLVVHLLFGVASMTLAAVATSYGLNLACAALTGSYVFTEAHLPIAVFLGTHLLFNDPSTSPRSDLGRILFGMFYGTSILLLFATLGAVGVPTFYDKLLGVPLLNLMIQYLDRFAEGPRLRRFVPLARLDSIPPRKRNLVYVGLCVLLFASMQANTRVSVAVTRGDLFLAKGRTAEAIATYRDALEVEPNHPAAMANLGYALVLQGRGEQARPLLHRSLELVTDEVRALSNIGVALMRIGDVESAVDALRRAAALAPDEPVVQLNLGLALVDADPAAAAEHFRSALRARPDWPKPMAELAWVLATDPEILDPEEALALAARGAELNRHRDPRLLDALAAAQAGAGRFDEAIGTAEAAATIARESAPRLLPGIRLRIARYRAGLPAEP